MLYYRPLFVGISPPLASKCCQSEAPMGKAPERVNWSMCYFPTQCVHLSPRGKEGKRNSKAAFPCACPGEGLACRRSSIRVRHLHNGVKSGCRAAGRADMVAPRWRRFGKRGAAGWVITTRENFPRRQECRRAAGGVVLTRTRRPHPRRASASPSVHEGAGRADFLRVLHGPLRRLCPPPTRARTRAGVRPRPSPRRPPAAPRCSLRLPSP